MHAQQLSPHALVKTADFNVPDHHFFPERHKTGFFPMAGKETHHSRFLMAFTGSTPFKMMLYIEKNLYTP